MAPGVPVAINGTVPVPVSSDGLNFLNVRVIGLEFASPSVGGGLYGEEKEQKHLIWEEERSIFPDDEVGLVALWREALLAQAVLLGQTQGYKHHLQLARFRASATPGKSIAAYLSLVHAEARKRGYRLHATKIGRSGNVELLTVTTGQLKCEWEHLIRRLESRAPWLSQVQDVARPKAHPLFRLVAGGIAAWEAVAADVSLRGAAR